MRYWSATSTVITSLTLLQATRFPLARLTTSLIDAGALRDALVKNFGSLVNLPELATLDVDFPRERYRDALMAALSSFLQGPTVACH